MDFRQLETFVATVEHKNFSAAAESLYLAQPTVSTHIHALEKELHVRLIRRTSKHFEITPEGQRLYNYAVALLQLQRKAVHELDRSSTRGLHIGASSIPGQFILPRLLTVYREQIPDVHFEVQLADSIEIIQQVERGTLDVGLVGTQIRANCVFHPIAVDELVVVTPNTPPYQQMQADGWSMEVLFQSPFLMRAERSGTTLEMEKFLAKWGLSVDDLQVAARVNDAETLLNCVICGLGISIMSRRMAEPQAELGRLLMCPLEQQTLLRQLYLIYQKDDCLPELVQQFVSFAEKQLDT